MANDRGVLELLNEIKTINQDKKPDSKELSNCWECNINEKNVIAQPKSKESASDWAERLDPGKLAAMNLKAKKENIAHLQKLLNAHNRGDADDVELGEILDIATKHFPMFSDKAQNIKYHHEQKQRHIEALIKGIDMTLEDGLPEEKNK